MNKKLYRDEQHRVLAGVCSGLAEYLEMDVTAVRLLWAFTSFIMFVGFPAYIIFWIVVPRKNYFGNFNNPTVDYTVPPQQPNEPFTNIPPYKSSSPFSSDPFAGKPFNAPFPPPPGPGLPKQRSHAGVIFGMVLILLGAIFLIDQLNILPDLDFANLWPLVLVAIGCALIVSGQQKQRAAQAAFQEPAKGEDEAPTKATPADDTFEQI